MCASLAERLLTSAELDDADARRLLASARRLRHAMRGGAERRLLGGRHLAIAGADDLFELAATRLGARVSRIGAELLLADSPHAAAVAARMLPRLYDALECPLLPAERALALHRRCGVPVYLGLAGAAHPAWRLLREMGEMGEESGAPPGVDAMLLVQAVLVETLT